MTYRRILIAVDESPIAAHAVDVGLELTRSLGGEAAFIHVVDSAYGFAPESEVSPDELMSLAQREGQSLLAKYQRQAASQPITLQLMPTGEPGAEIVQAAADWPADIIVIGSHGRRGVQRLLVGSIAEEVMRNAPCPVLIVRTPQ